MSKSTFRIVLFLSILVRGVLGFLPGYGPDIVQMKSWALMSAKEGMSSVFDTTTYDYPPLFILLVRPIGEAYLGMHPEIANASVRRGDGDVLVFRTSEGVTFRHPTPRTLAHSPRPMRPLPGDRLFTFLIKFPALLFDFVIAAALYWLVAFRASWGLERRMLESGRVAAVLWLCNPAVLWDTAYWGLPDSIHSAFALLAVGIAGSVLDGSALDGSAPVGSEEGRARSEPSARLWFLAGGALAAGVLMKPLAAPLVPLLVWAAVWGGARLRAVFALAFGAAIVALALYLPFAFAGVGATALRRLFSDLDVMPYTSVNAHNLWWWFGSWRNANDPLLFGVSARTVGLSTFLVLVTILLGSRSISRTRHSAAAPASSLDRARGHLESAQRGSDGTSTADLALLAASISAVFFFISTHMHENHLFMVLPFLTALAGRGARFRWFLIAASLGLLSNLALHDPNLGMPASANAPLTRWVSVASQISTAWIGATVGLLFLTSLRSIGRDLVGRGSFHPEL